MKMATISQVKSQLSALIKEVEAGETIIIVNRDRPVARLEPVRPAGDEDTDARLARLERLGIIRRGRKPADPTLVDRPIPRAPKGAGLLSALLEEREQGR
jgi:prevent-host-death family protein